MKRLDQEKHRQRSVKDLEFEIPSWNQLYILLLNIAEKIKKSGFKPDIILGISRGGWVPARIISDLIENPKLASVTVEFYIGVAEQKQEPALTQPIAVSVKNKKVLVVDDLTDTGKSLEHVNAHLKNRGATEIRIATIYHKKWSVTIPHYYAKETRHWIIFPWEQKETVRKIVKKFQTERRKTDEAKEKLINSGLDRNLVEQFIQEITEEKH